MSDKQSQNQGTGYSDRQNQKNDQSRQTPGANTNPGTRNKDFNKDDQRQDKSKQGR